MKFAASILAALLASASVANAQSATAPLQLPSTITSVTPIYSQILSFSLPTKFGVVYEKNSGTDYIREAVLNGESVDSWSQMLTVTGAKGLATNANVTPRRFAEAIAFGYKKSCPTSFNASTVLEGRLPGGQPVYSALLGCGSSVSPAGMHSETVLITVIEGEADIYSVQWAERGSPVGRPVEFDSKRWVGRLKSLFPIKVCARVPGEVAPFPSCLAQK